MLIARCHALPKRRLPTFRRIRIFFIRFNLFNKISLRELTSILKFLLARLIFRILQLAKLIREHLYRINVWKLFSGIENGS